MKCFGCLARIAATALLVTGTGLAKDAPSTQPGYYSYYTGEITAVGKGIFSPWPVWIGLSP